jgi:di/tricarboxylate transporter
VPDKLRITDAQAPTRFLARFGSVFFGIMADLGHEVRWWDTESINVAAHMASTHAATFGEVILTTDLAVVLLLLAAAIAMFIAERPRMDMVAMIMIVAMPFTGIISINEALAGFSDSNIVLIAALFVIGEGLVRTGVARRLGDWLNASAGTSETRLLVLLMIVVGGLGALMSSTAVVAIFIPVVLRICGNTGTPPSRLMMPLSVAALVSGMLTLVATAPNLVVNAELARHGLEGFRFFSFTPLGLPMLVLAISYMVFARRMLGAMRDDS